MVIADALELLAEDRDGLEHHAFGAVVRAEPDERVVELALGLEQVEHTADLGVHDFDLVGQPGVQRPRRTIAA